MNENEFIVSLEANSYVFVGQKPVAVLFDKERVDVKSWREVFSVILKRCNELPENHEMLMYMREKASGKVRKFLSASPDSMTRPLQVDDSLYAETHYGSSTLMHILLNRILVYVKFDCSDIYIVLKS